MYSSQQSLNDPSQYLDYDGTVRLFIEFAPWRYVWHLKGVSIGSNGCLAELARRNVDEDFTKEDLDTFLREGRDYTIQLEYQHAPITFPVVQARLIDSERAAGGLRLQFHFLDTDEDVDLLLEEISKRNDGF